MLRSIVGAALLGAAVGSVLAGGVLIAGAQTGAAKAAEVGIDNFTFNPQKLTVKAGGLGNLGNEQLEWLEADVKSRTASTPIVVFAHIPLWTVYPEWGWGTQDGAQVLTYLKKFGSVTVLNGHIHQVMQKVEGNATFHTARSTAFPQPAPGAAPSPGPMKVPDDQLRKMLGIANVTFKQNEQRLAIIDTALQS